MKNALPWPWIMLLAGSTILPASTATAQTDLAQFLTRAREGTAGFRDLQVAVAAGYRPVGLEAPGMGQHWVHPGRVMAAEYEPARPAVLTYMNIDGIPTLAGVAYAIPIGPGDRLPDVVVNPNAWHVHRGTVADEGALFGHHMTSLQQRAGPGVAMLHAWIWLENPDGLFTPDNWALPFLRRRLEVPAVEPGVRRDAALALALPGEGKPFYLAQLRSGGRNDQETAGRILTGCAVEVEQWFSAVKGRSLGDIQVAWLAERWGECQRRLNASDR